MARYTLAQFRKDTRGLPGTLTLEAIDEGSGIGAPSPRPWQAFRVKAVDVDVESAPTAVEVSIVPIKGAHG